MLYMVVLNLSLTIRMKAMPTMGLLCKLFNPSTLAPIEQKRLRKH